jgi:uncharacterized protein
VFVPFLQALRDRGVPVGLNEAVALAGALKKGLHGSSLDGFYYVARALLVHTEAHLDAFDEAFLAHFRGIETARSKLKEALFDWLAEAARIDGMLDEAEAALLEEHGLEELLRLFEERLREQTERHDGGNKWIGTAGTSPFGHGGRAARPGIRVGGTGGRRSAMKVADARAYQPYRGDLVLDVRQMQVALRKLRAFVREGGDEELDLEGTIAATAKNAGELEVVTRPPRRPDTRVILMMDVGGSMDPHAHLVSRLFSAAKATSHWKELKTYYFHNCVYGQVYETERFEAPVLVRDLLNACGPHYKLIVVGDALMAPHELWARGGTLRLGDDRGIPGLGWLELLARHFDRSVWLNPEPPRYWRGGTAEDIRGLFEMKPLTLDGLGEAVDHLRGGRRARR